jgi:pimeloyl-ACP methyl ester carboxylesterase
MRVSEERLAPVNGIEIAYQEIGEPDGEPLVLVMGLGTQMNGWDLGFCELLADRGYRVVRFDNRDVGHSTWIDAPPPKTVAMLMGLPFGLAYKLDDMAADTAGLIEHLGLESAHVVGASQGGMIAQVLAYTWPQRVRSLGLIMTGAGRRVASLPRLRALGTLLARAPREREAFIDQVTKTFEVIGSPEYPPDRERLRQLIAESYDRGHNPAGAARQLHAVTAAPERTRRLLDVSAPTVVIHGAVPGPVDAATSGDFVYVKAVSQAGPVASGVTNVFCPPGTRTTGVGASMSESNGNNAWVNGIFPLDASASDEDTDGDDGASAQGWNASGTKKSLTVYAICSQGLDVGDLTYNREDSVLSSPTTGAGFFVMCAGPDQEVTGGGGGTTANPYDHVSITSPNLDHFSYGFVGTNPNGRTLTGVAICLPALNRSITIAEKTVEVRPFSIGAVKVSCPAGTKVSGGGVGPGSLRVIVSSRPFDGPDADSVTDDGWATKVRNPDDEKRNSTVKAVCAGPIPGT